VSLNKHHSHNCSPTVPQVVAVDPGHQRKGIGKALMLWGIGEAAKDNRDVWLIATPAGRGLYDSLGFETLGEAMIEGDLQAQMVKRANKT